MGISIKGFLETTFIDWPGKLAAVVFLPGCNFRCPFCHNGELVTGAAGLPDIPLGDVFDRIVDLGWVDGVVVSGGEATVHEDLPRLAAALSSRGLAVKLDTNGSRPAVLADLLGRGLVQHVDMDVKAPLASEDYRLMAGVPVAIDRIRESIDLIAASGVPHRFRTTVVPGRIGREEVGRIAAALPPTSPLHLQAFDPRRALDANLAAECPRPTAEEMKALRDLLN